MKNLIILTFVLLLIGCGSVPVKEEAESSALPISLEEAVDEIVSDLSEDDKKTVKETSFDDLILYHHGWGTGIRNSFGLWRGNNRLLESSCGDPNCHPDDASMKIIYGVWNKLNDNSIRYEPNRQGDIELLKNIAEEIENDSY